MGALPDDVIGDVSTKKRSNSYASGLFVRSRSKRASASVRVIGATEEKYSRSCASSRPADGVAGLDGVDERLPSFRLVAEV